MRSWHGKDNNMYVLYRLNVFSLWIRTATEEKTSSQTPIFGSKWLLTDKLYTVPFLGPDAMKEDALGLLRKLLLSKFNFVVRSGLKIQIFFAFFSLSPNRISSSNANPFLVKGCFRKTLSLTILIMCSAICRFSSAKA